MDKQISKNVEEIHTPAIKILIRLLVSGIIVAATIVVTNCKQDKNDCKEKVNYLNLKIDSLHDQKERADNRASQFESMYNIQIEVNKEQKKEQIDRINENEKYLNRISKVLKKQVNK